MAMKLEILSCKETVCFWTQMCFCKTSSPVVGFPHANWAVVKKMCHSFALLVAIGFPSSWNMIIPSQCWVTKPPNEWSTGDDQSDSVFRVVGDPALWLIPIVGKKSLVQWVKINKKSIETTAGWFFEHSENMESHKGHFPVTTSMTSLVCDGY